MSREFPINTCNEPMKMQYAQLIPYSIIYN